MAVEGYTIFPRCTQILMQKIGLDEIVDVAVQNPGDVAGLDIRPMILDHFVGVQHIRSDLTPPGNILLGLVDRIKLFILLSEFHFIETRTEIFHGHCLVLVL